MSSGSRDPLRLLQEQAAAANERPDRQPGIVSLDGLLFEAMPLPALLLSRAGRILRANAQARDRLQMAEELAVPALADGLLNCLSRADRGRLFEALRLTLPGQMRRLERLHLCAGSAPEVAVTAWLQAVPDPAGGHAVLFQWQDVAVELLGALQQGLFEQAPDAWQAFDAQGHQVYANPTARLWLGQGDGPDQAGVVPLDRLLPLGAALRLQQKMQEVQRSGQAQCFDHELQARGGSRPIRVSCFPLRGARGEVVGVGSCWHDLTGEWEQRSEHQFSEALFLQAHDSLAVLDRAGLVRRVNPAFERNTGFSAANMVGRSIRVLHDPAEGDISYDAIWALVKRNGLWSGQLRCRNAAGEHRLGWAVINVIQSAVGLAEGYLLAFTDLTELYRAHAQVIQLASFDTLTGLPNRSLFQDRLRQQQLLADRQLQSFALMFIDLDHFKEVNDSQGHHVGVELLMLIAHRLRDSVREMDTVARLGGDEFVVLLPNTGRAAAQELAQRLLRYLHEPLKLDQLPGYRPQASVGLAMYPDDGRDLETLICSADQAMYAAKRAGRNQVRPYQPD